MGRDSNSWKEYGGKTGPNGPGVGTGRSMASRSRIGYGYINDGRTEKPMGSSSASGDEALR